MKERIDHRREEKGGKEMLFKDIQDLVATSDEFFANQGLDFGKTNAYGQIGNSRIPAWYDVEGAVDSSLKGFKDEGLTTDRLKGGYKFTDSYKGVRAWEVAQTGFGVLSTSKAETQIGFEVDYEMHQLSNLDPAKQTQYFTQKALNAADLEFQYKFDASNQNHASMIKALQEEGGLDPTKKKYTNQELMDAKKTYIETQAKKILETDANGNLTEQAKRNALTQSSKMNYLRTAVQRESGMVASHTFEADAWSIARWKRNNEIADQNRAIAIPATAGTKTTGDELKTKYNTNNNRLSVLKSQLKNNPKPDQKAEIENEIHRLESGNKLIKQVAISSIPVDKLAKNIQESNMFEKMLNGYDNTTPITSVAPHPGGGKMVHKPSIKTPDGEDLREVTSRHIAEQLHENPDYQMQNDSELKKLWKLSLVMDKGQTTPEERKEIYANVDNMFTEQQGHVAIKGKDTKEVGLAGAPLTGIIDGINSLFGTELKFPSFTTDPNAGGLPIIDGGTPDDMLNNMIFGNTDERTYTLDNSTLHFLDKDSKGQILVNEIQNRVTEGTLMTRGLDASNQANIQNVLNDSDNKKETRLLGKPHEGEIYFETSYTDEDDVRKTIVYSLDGAPEEKRSIDQFLQESLIELATSSINDDQVKGNAKLSIGTLIPVMNEQGGYSGKNVGQRFAQDIGLLERLPAGQVGEEKMMLPPVYGELTVIKHKDGLYEGILNGPGGSATSRKVNNLNQIQAWLGESAISVKRQTR